MLMKHLSTIYNLLNKKNRWIFSQRSGKEDQEIIF